jgi:hypothetical protein
MLVQEAIHSSKGCGEKGIVIKLDMENDFDMVRHSFMFAMMTIFGFGVDFLAWISTCIHDP